jgi:hypothetical protein
MGVWLPCKHAETKINIIIICGTLEGAVNNVTSIGCESFVRECVTTMFRNTYNIAKTFFGVRGKRSS